MGQITSLFAYKVAAVIEPALDRRALLATLDLDPAQAVNPGRMVSAADYYRFLEAIARSERQGHTLPLRVGATMRCDEYGAFGLAWKSAPDLRGSFLRAERYSRVLTSTTGYSVEASDSGLFYNLHRSGPRDLGLRLSNEASIASVLSISREVTTAPLAPLAVYFKHPAPAITADHEKHFACPVHFSADRDALLFSAECVAVPNKLGDTGIAAFFDQHLEAELAKLEDDSALDRRVKNQLTRALSEGVPAISDIAGKLAMSGRSLQRRLSERGLTYQTLVDETRRELAMELLAGSEMSLADIAFLTGFAEQSSFNRAFKRWAGQTPRSYRLQGQLH